MVRVRSYTRRSPKGTTTVSSKRTDSPGWPQIVKTKTDRGIPIRVVFDEDTIKAYRGEDATIISQSFQKEGQVRLEVEPELSKYFTEEPVMKISKWFAPGNMKWILRQDSNVDESLWAEKNLQPVRIGRNWARAI